MFLAEPPPTSYDLRFRLLGIPVRVAPFFWLVTALLGYNIAKEFGNVEGSGLTVGTALIIWVLAAFLSILVHEFGHALAFRYFGIEVDVVLFQFGGLAIPRRAFAGQRPLQNPMQNILITIAGPAIQLALGIAVLAGFHWAGYLVMNPLPFIHQLDFLQTGGAIPSLGLLEFEYSLVWASIWWALLNLLPIFPLDGGQISRELFSLANPHEGIRYSLMLSMGTAAAGAAWGFMHNDTFMAMWFAWFAYSSYMTLQALYGGGRFYR